MYAKHPGIADRWQEHTPEGAHLPEKVSFALLHKLAAMALAVPKLPNLAATPKFDIGKAIAEHVPTQGAAPAQSVAAGSLQFSSLANKAQPPPLPNRIPVPPAHVQAAAAPNSGMPAVVPPRPAGQLAPREPGSPFRPGDSFQGTSLPIPDPSTTTGATRIGSDESRAAYETLPPHIRQAIEAHPHVTQRGMLPQQAMILMDWGAQPDEDLTGAITRQLGSHMPAQVVPPRPTVGMATGAQSPRAIKAAMWGGFVDELHKEAGRFTWLKDRALDLTDKDSDTRKHISEKVHLGVNRVQHGAINAKEKAREAIHSYTEKKARYLQSPVQLATPKTRVLSAAPPNKSFAIK